MSFINLNKKNVILFSLFSMSLNHVDAKTIEQRLEEIEKSNQQLRSELEDIKFKQDTHNYSFWGAFVNRLEESHLDNPAINAADSKVRAMSMSFELGMNFDVSEQLKFYSAFGMSKIYNENGRIGDDFTIASQRDFAGSRTLRSGPYLLVDRAYLDYRFKNIPLSFMIGRLSTYNGAPLNEFDQLKKLGTYPALSYNAIFDGIALGYDFSSLFDQKHKLQTRFLYTPFYNVNVGKPREQLTYAGTNEKLKSESPMYTLMFDFETDHWRDFAKINAIAQFYQIDDWYTFAPTSTTDVMGSTLPAGKVFGNYNAFAATGFLSLENILKSNFSLSVSLKRDELKHPRIAINNLGAFGDLRGKNLKGAATLINLRYQIPLASLNNPQIGYEYLNSNSNVTLSAGSRMDLANFYFTHGRGFHYYYSQPLTSELTARMGYYRVVNQSNYYGTSAYSLYSGYVQLRMDF